MLSSSPTQLCIWQWLCHRRHSSSRLLRLTTLQDLDGDHVIQKCLKHLSPKDAQFPSTLLALSVSSSALIAMAVASYNVASVTHMVSLSSTSSCSGFLRQLRRPVHTRPRRAHVLPSFGSELHLPATTSSSTLTSRSGTLWMAPRDCSAARFHVFKKDIRSLVEVTAQSDELHLISTILSTFVTNYAWTVLEEC